MNKIMESAKDFGEKVIEKSPKVEKFLYCIDLKHAGFLLGILCVLYSFFTHHFVIIIALPGHVYWFVGLIKEKPKFLLIGGAFHFCLYLLVVYETFKGAAFPYGLISGILESSLYVYFMIVECSLYKQMMAHDDFTSTDV